MSSEVSSDGDEKYQLIVAKAILAGETGVGKTSIRRSYFGENFKEDHMSTLGADFSVKRIPHSKSTILEFQIWDLAGQMSFNPLRKRFFIGASALFLIFDLTDRKSFEELDGWFDDFWDSFDNRKDIPMTLIGNKDDLQNQKVTDEEMEEFWEKTKKKYPDISGKTHVIKTSAKTGEHIEDAFSFMSGALIELFS